MRRIFALGASLFYSVALAAPDEIQVYNDEINAPGQYGIELHVNYVPEGANQASYRGESIPNHRWQVMPEFSYGINQNWEAGIYIPFARENDGQINENGFRFRMKYIATPAGDSRIFWGLNSEMGYSDHRVAEYPWSLELRPIVGFRSENYLLSLNPIVNSDMARDARPVFEPALKISRKFLQAFHLGVEYFGSYGEINKLLPLSERTHYLFATVDYEQKNFDMNFGVGRGDSNAQDNWIVKAIIALPLF
jgi:hypothetical protein